MFFYRWLAAAILRQELASKQACFSSLWLRLYYKGRVSSDRLHPWARRIRFWPWSNAPRNGNAVADPCHFALR
jgi:hypothetical protein